MMSGNIEQVMSMYPGKEDVYERGRYGENVFLLAMSLATPQALTIARYLVRVLAVGPCLGSGDETPTLSLGRPRCTARS